MAAEVVKGELKGGELMDRYLRTITKKLGTNVAVRVGWLAGARYSGTHPIRGGKTFDGPVAQVAFWNEHGTTKMPARPMVRATIANHSDQWGDRLGKTLRATKYNARQSLAIMGRGIQQEIRQTIVEWTDPPNSAYTVAKKGFNKPLIDSGTMQRAVDFQVIEGDE